MSSICIFPPQKGFAGPAAFARRLAGALRSRGVSVGSDPLVPGCQAVLVIGGSKRLDLLWQARRRGVRIVQRLNGMNWLQRKTATGLRHFVRAEVNNFLLATIRRRLAQDIIYQSEFSRGWWGRVYGLVPAQNRVIYNGVDLQAFSPAGPETRPGEHFRLLLVEGQLGAGGMHTGLENAIDLLAALSAAPNERWELVVAGEVPDSLRRCIISTSPGLWITWAGVLKGEAIAALDRSAHILFSADLNAACPNSVIEALACGLPVAAYATGALAEMVTGQAGRVVPYGRDHWQLQKPLVAPLAEAVRSLARAQNEYRPGARARAEEAFDIQAVVEKYLAVLL